MKINGNSYTFSTFDNDPAGTILTIAEVRLETAEKESAPDEFALARQHAGDNFCKSTGRIISLSRLMDLQKLGELARLAIWGAYFQQYHFKWADTKKNFAALLNKLGLSRNERVVLWDQYFEKYPQNK